MQSLISQALSNGVKRVALFCLFVVPVFAVAQERSIHELRILGGTDAMTREVQKLVYELVVSLDQQAAISFHEERLKVKIDVVVTRAYLLAEINGLGVGEFEAVDTTLEDAAAFPTKMHTGDPAVDEASHEAAKNAWREAHPEAHEKYLEELRTTPPVKHE